MDEQEEFEFRYRFEKEQEAAKAKSSSSVDSVVQTGKNALGGLDAALTMGASVPSYVWSGLTGLSQLYADSAIAGVKQLVKGEKPDTDKILNRAGDRVRLQQEHNFGFGQPKPFTKEGGEVMGMVEHGVEAAKGIGGDLGYKVGGELGRTHGEIAAEMLTNLIPIPSAKGVRAAGNTIQNRASTKRGQQNKPTTSKSVDEVLAARAAAQKPTAKPPVDPVVAERMAKMTDSDIMARLQKIDRELNMDLEPMKKEGVRVAEKVEGGEPFYVGQDGQVFKGDVNDPNTRFSYDRLEQAWSDALENPDHFPERAAEPRRFDPETERMVPAVQGDPLKNLGQFDDMGPAQAVPDRIAALETERLQRRSEEAKTKDRYFAMETPPEAPMAQQPRPNGQSAIKGEGIGLGGPTRRGGNVPHTRKQGGYIDPSVFREGFEKLKKLKLPSGDVYLRAMADAAGGVKIEAVDDNGKWVGEANFVPMEDGRYVPDTRKLDSFENDAYLSSEDTSVRWDSRGNGLATEMYKFANDLGNGMDIRKSENLLDDGKKMWDRWESTGRVDKEGNFRPYGTPNPLKKPPSKGHPARSQGGWIGDGDSQTGSSATPGPKPNKPQLTEKQLAERKAQRKFVERFPVKTKALDEFGVIRDKDEALALSKEASDIGPDFGQKSLVSGINAEVALSNNPMLKYARTLLRDARVSAEAFSRKFVTNDNDGLSPLWSRMNKQQRVQVMKALQDGDRHRMFLDGEMMNEMGLTDVQQRFINTFYKADGELFTNWKKSLESVGLHVPEFREGHFPGIFTGAYKVLVMKDKSALGVIAVDTVAQKKLAMEYFKKEMPDATFIEQDRTSLAGTTKHYYSDIFSGMTDVLQLLGKNDPKFAEVMEIVNGAIKQSNNALFRFNVHELAKKGVVGNEGNKPWLSPERNAEDAFKALVRYFEEGAQHHALQVPLKEIRDVMLSDQTEHMPNARKYLDRYLKKVTGDDVSRIGAAINTLIDAPFNLVPSMAWGNGKMKVGMGVGAVVPLKLAGATKNFMNQMFMGWGNYMFTAAQLLQPLQTGVPFQQLVAGRLGLTPDDVVTSLGKGGVDFMAAVTNDMTGTKLPVARHMQEAYTYAKERGLLEFSEMERAFQGTQSKLGRAKDRIAEANMKFGEYFTRTPMLMAYTDMMVKAGIPVKEALPIAENLTQFSMIDYHAWERPMLYSQLGVIGQFAGGLTTFKHGFMSQQAYLSKQMVKPTEGQKRQLAPFLASIAAMLAFAGITGTPFYNELDSLYKYITNTFGKGQRSIREDVLESLPEWSKSGAISAATGLNMQGKFSSADMIPDSILRAVSPHLEAAGKVIVDAGSYAKNQDQQALRNLVMGLTPSSLKGVTEDLMGHDEDGHLLGRDGLPVGVRPRGEVENGLGMKVNEREARKWTGLRSQQEAIERDSMWDARQKFRKDNERKIAIAREYERRILNDTLTDKKQAELEAEYEERGGDVQQLYKLFETVELKRGKTEKERYEGTPTTPQGLRRWEYFNK